MTYQGDLGRKKEGPRLRAFFWIVFLLQHRAEICAGDHTGVAAEPAGLDVGLRGHILGLALGKDLVRNFQRDAGVGDINVDDIALLDQADGAAGSGFGADVADGRAAGCAGEAAVGDEGHVLSSFIPASAEVGFSISRIPGPPLGPS